MNEKLFYIYIMCPRKMSPFNFLNNSVKNEPISTIFDVRNPEEICD